MGWTENRGLTSGKIDTGQFYFGKIEYVSVGKKYNMTHVIFPRKGVLRKKVLQKDFLFFCVYNQFFLFLDVGDPSIFSTFDLLCSS